MERKLEVLTARHLTDDAVKCLRGMSVGTV